MSKQPTPDSSPPPAEAVSPDEPRTESAAASKAASETFDSVAASEPGAAPAPPATADRTMTAAAAGQESWGDDGNVQHLPTHDDEWPDSPPFRSPSGSGTDVQVAGTPRDDEPAQLHERNPLRYQLIGEHGRGGLGRVMRARDRELHRDVAVKELLRHSRSSEARFLREAMITARLQHPNIVPVHEAGRWPDGRPFYTMKLVQGRPLKELINDCKTLDERLALIPHVIAVADAVAYAHSKRIIHRDLKPSNVIVGDFGETVVIDWGLAKDLSVDEDIGEDDNPYRLHPDSALTVAGGVLGTPAYMSPEQARGDAVDERTDVYALGALLFHVLTGNLPFAGHSADSVLTLLTVRTPLERIQDGSTPADLIAICYHCTGLSAHDRYPSARGVAEDLHRYQNGQLVFSRHYTRVTLFQRWVSRHRTLSISALLLLATFLVAMSRVRQERDQSDKLRVTAERERSLAQAQLSVSKARTNELVLQQARAQLQTDPTLALEWLKSYTGADFSKFRMLALTALARGVANVAIPFEGNLDALTAAFVDSDHEIVTLRSDGSIRIWNTDGTNEHLIVENAEPTIAVANAAGLVAYGKSGELYVYDVSRNTTQRRGQYKSVLTKLAMTPTGSLLYAGTSNGGVYESRAIAKTHTATQTGSARLIYSHSGAVHWMAISGDGQHVVSTPAENDDKVIAWNADQGTSTVLGRSAPWARVAFGSASTSAIWSAPNGDVLWHDLESHLERRFPTGARLAGPFALSTDNRYLAAGLSSHEVLVIDTQGWKEVLRAPTASRIFSIEFHPARNILAFGDNEGIHQYSLDDRTWTHFNGAFGIRRLAYSSSGRLMVSACSDTSIRVWGTDGTSSRYLDGDSESISTLEFSANGQFLAASGYDNVVRIWNTNSWERRELHGPTQTVFDLRFSPDAKTIAATTGGARTYIWRLDETRQTVLDTPGENVEFISFLDNDQLVTASTNGVLTMWNLNTKSHKVIGQVPGKPLRPVHSRDRILVGTQSGYVLSFDPHRSSTTFLCRHPGALHSIATTGNGKTLVTAGPVGLFTWNLFGPPSPKAIDRYYGGRSRIRTTNDGTYASLFSYSLPYVRVLNLRAKIDERLYASSLLVGAEFIRDAQSGSTSLLYAGREGTAYVWSQDGRMTAAAPRLEIAISLAATTPGDLLAIGYRDGRIAVLSGMPPWHMKSTNAELRYQLANMSSATILKERTLQMDHQ